MLGKKEGRLVAAKALPNEHFLLSEKGEGGAENAAKMLGERKYCFGTSEFWNENENAVGNHELVIY